MTELKKSLVEWLGNVKWHSPTSLKHVCTVGESYEHIQSVITISYSDGMVRSEAAGTHNHLMNLLIQLAHYCKHGVTYSTNQVTTHAESSPHHDAKTSATSYIYCLGPLWWWIMDREPNMGRC